MEPRRWSTWLRGTATFVFVAALCLAVAVLVIALIPGSPVVARLPASRLSGLDGLAPGVTLDPAGWADFKITDPSLAQRLLYAATVVPGLLLVAEMARRMAAVLRSAVDGDPFTDRTARQLNRLAKLTAFGGLVPWTVTIVAKWQLSATMLAGAAAVEPGFAVLGWLAVGLIIAAFAQLITRGVAMRTELDTVI
jgi:DUF2975 family protein